MKRSLRRALWAGAVVAVTLTAVPMATAFGAGSVTATFAKVQDWGTGHEAKVTVTNGSTASVSTWRIEFDLPSGTTISSAWDADVTSSGNHYVAVKKSWAGALAPGASFSWGYNGAGPYAAPLNCTVNGAACGGGTLRRPPRRRPLRRPRLHRPRLRRRRRPRRPLRRRTREPRRSSATSPSGASTPATTTSRTSRPAARPPS
ncbi:hypothetical protein GCM10027614_27020 [Micromonospora vulcania]